MADFQRVDLRGSRFERADLSAAEFSTKCNLTTGHGCVMPPQGPGHFYPCWTQAKVGGSCVWDLRSAHGGGPEQVPRRHAADQFWSRISQRLGLDETAARRVREAVIETLAEAVSAKEWFDLIVELPQDYRRPIPARSG